MSAQSLSQRPTRLFLAAAWASLLVGAAAYLVGLRKAGMQRNEQGYYLAVLMYGLFAVVSLQKSVRDRLEGLPVSGIYFGLFWLSLGLTMFLLTVGLWNAMIVASEKGSHAMSFLLSLSGAVAVQKNVRDLAPFRSLDADCLPMATPWA